MKNKVLRFLLSLVIAFGIWLYVVSVVSPESEAIIQDIPVVLEGENVLAERNLIIISNKNFTVDLKLFGNRVDLKKLSASNITIVADLSQITGPGEHNVRYSIDYPSTVEDGNVDALERDPQYIKLTVAERDWKNVDVKVQYSGTVPENYMADRQNPQLDHTVVTVSGPKEYLKEVDHVSIFVNLTDKVDTIVGNFRPSLCTADGTPFDAGTILPNGMVVTDEMLEKLTISETEIHATVKIHKIKQIPLEVEVITGGGLEREDVTLVKNLETIVVSGSDAVLSNLEKIVVGQIDLSDLMENTELTFDITMPAGVSNVTGVTELKVTVELLKQLEVRTFTVTQIRVDNVPGNRHVKLVTQVLTVKIRGTAEALDNLKAEDIVAVVDCSDITDIVNMTTPLNVTIHIAGENGAGAVGQYQVIAEITEVSAGSMGG